MEDSTVILIAGIVVALVVIYYLLSRIIRIIPEYERLVILQLGRYKATRGPGLIFVIPLLEKAYKVDLRERFLDIPAQTAITKDNASIGIDFLVYYRIVDPMLSVLKVDHVVRASLNMATTTLRAVIGDIDLDSVLSKREQINDILRVKLDETTERWGMKVTSVEIREIEPPREIQEAMNRQMSAERDRRAQVTRAEGERESAIAVAQGEKQAAILRSEGLKESAVLEATGERDAQRLRAEGYAQALTAIYNQAKDIDQKTMALQYLEMLSKIGNSPSTKFVLPMELTQMVQQFAQNMSFGAGTGNGHKQEEKLPSGTVNGGD